MWIMYEKSLAINIHFKIIYPAMREELFKKLLRDVKETSILTQSKEIKIPYATLHRIVNGKSDGSMRIWERIEKHYKLSA